LPFCLVGSGRAGQRDHWARELVKMGHHARLMPPAYVNPTRVGTRTTRR
jgi:transposase